jgi:hypothetical protein
MMSDYHLYVAQITVRHSDETKYTKIMFLYQSVGRYFISRKLSVSDTAAVVRFRVLAYLWSNCRWMHYQKYA